MRHAQGGTVGTAERRRAAPRGQARAARPAGNARAEAEARAAPAPARSLDPPSQALTVVAEIDPARRAELERRLAAIADDLKDNPVLVPGRLPHTHFTRFVIIDDTAEHVVPQARFPALLVWESNHDGRFDAYLDAVTQAAAAGLDALFGCCRDYPGAADEPAFHRWMRERSLPAAAFYCGYRGVSRARVANDYAVHQAMRRFVDEERPQLLAGTELDAFDRIRAHLKSRADLDLARPGDPLARIRRQRAGLVVALVVLSPVILALALLLGPALLVGWLVLRWKERTDVPEPISAPVHDPRDLRRFEDRIIQNQLTHLVDIKPGWFRLTLLRGVLWLIDLLARLKYVHGHLGGITSIHFARWVILRDDRPGVRRRRHRLLFFSNYDGSWESYLGEFIDRAAGGLTAVWSNTEGFPRTRNLLRGGATDEERFKQWTRHRQIHTQVWWSGVPDSTVDNVRNDLWLRAGAAGIPTASELTEWLRRI